jgi:FMN reductase
MTHLIVSCSLSHKSKSYALAEQLQRLIPNSTLLDLRKHELPLCDASTCYSHPSVQNCQKIVNEASSIIVCAPIYNYDLNAAAKNFAELTGQGWREKVVSVVVAAGGTSSYMAPLSFVNSLMIDFRCIIVPRFVYAQGSAFNELCEITDSSIITRLTDLAETHTTLVRKLGH